MPGLQPSIDDVKHFWNENPLFKGELQSTPGSREWFEQLDQIQLNEVFKDNYNFFIPHLKPFLKVLDVGCGPGFWTRQMTRRKINYTGIDLTPKAIELAKKGQELFGHEGKLLTGNAEALPFADESFDHIHSVGVIHHTPDTEKCIDEFFRVLKPGGTGVCGVYYKNAILRNPLLLKISLFIMKIFNFGLKGRGREVMAAAQSPDDLVRIFDGAENPVGKAYTKEDLLRMFQKFNVESMLVFYFPTRAFKIKLPDFLRRQLNHHLGLMIAVRFSKPLK